MLFFNAISFCFPKWTYNNFFIALSSLYLSLSLARALCGVEEEKNELYGKKKSGEKWEMSSFKKKEA
jgi:hypothetical protein